jgi:cytoskeletal protein CcmA (bactofilin family)
VARQSPSPHRSAESETVLSEHTTLRGRVRGEGSLTVAGRVEGDIQIDGALTIAEGASVQSSVQASEVTILGELEGDGKVRGPVRLGSTASVQGDIKGSSFAMAAGASFSGRLDADFDLPQELTAERKRR